MRLAFPSGRVERHRPADCGGRALAPGIRAWCARPAAEQGERLGDGRVFSGRRALRGEREIVAGRHADAVDELLVGAQLAVGRKGQRAAVIEEVAGGGSEAMRAVLVPTRVPSRISFTAPSMRRVSA